MNKNLYFEKALEDLETLKQISYGTFVSYSNTNTEDKPVKKMKQALKNLEDYLKQVGELPKSQVDKALKESDFLISGVQNVFSFLKGQEGSLYEKLVADYTDVNHAYDQAKKNLSQKEGKDESTEASKITDQFLNNLVEVKRDRSYELFYISDENNKRFYTDALVQIICKHGKIHETIAEGDPLIKIPLWNSEEVKKTASHLIVVNDVPIRTFYKGAIEQLGNPFVENVHNAVMALLASRYESTVVRNHPEKSNLTYFNDFFYFLRKSCEAAHMVGNSTQVHHTTTLLSALSRGIFENKWLFEAASQYIYFNIHTTYGDKNIGQYVMESYEDIHRLMAKYPNGPLLKAIDHLLDPRTRMFDPMLMGAYPSYEGTLKINEKAIRLLRSPSPVRQDSITYAVCNDEFLTFLKAKADVRESVLIINIQNRQARKDRARSRVIEENVGDNGIQLLAFPEPEDLLQWIETTHGEQETFAEFFDNIQNEFSKPKVRSVFFAPDSSRELLGELLFKGLPMLKDVFFSKKKILFKNDKVLIIHLIYHLMVFKLIESLNVDTIIVMSKDGLDYASIFISGFAFFGDESWDEHRLKLLIAKLLAPTLSVRDRLIFPHHLELFSKFLNCLRKNRQHIKQLIPLLCLNPERSQLSDYLNEFPNDL